MTVHTDGRFIQQIKFRNRYSISMESIDIVRKQVAESERVKAELSKNEEVIAAIAKAADVCTEAYRRGNKTMFAGNGGSAADAQHLVGEFVSKFYFDRPGIPSIALTTDPVLLQLLVMIMDMIKYLHANSRHKVWQEMFLLVFLLQVIRKIL